MAKRVVLTLMEGSFDLGFTAILRIRNDDAHAETEIQILGKLPPAPNILELFHHWRSSYHQMVMPHSRLTPKLAQVTNFSCRELGLKLALGMNDWLNSGLRDWQKIRDGLQQNLKKTDETHVLIQTNDKRLWQLPWHLWDLIDDYPYAEVALSAPSAFVATSSGTPRSRRQQVKILAILGNSNGINVQKDRQLLENLPDAEVTFLVEPQHLNINDSLWEQPWDILFFAGHSRTEGESGRIYINQTDSLTIAELRYALRNAVANGLALAIFNSCDGLGLAFELEQLHIPQMIVMREPVPDLVAQKFLQYFLEALVQQDSSYLALREARQRLEPMEQQFPGATWLPMMYQNLATKPFTWSELRSGGGGRIRGTSRTFTQQNPQQQLLDDVNSEVESRLCSSLHRAVFINLLKEKQLQQVKRPWDVEVKIGLQPNTQLPLNTSIIEVFDYKEVAGRLLILGQPGSGKTTTLLELAKELIFRAQTTPEEPIPVLFNLSSWKDNRQPLVDWFVKELKLKYGVRVDIGRLWLDNQQLLPLLDGLDELESERQALCIEAINQFQQDYRLKSLVVCSRLLEYEICHTQLQLNGAICLLPLSKVQIREYLVSAERKELWQSIQDDPILLSMASSPLILSIIALTLQEQAIQEWQKFRSNEERRQYLFNVYIQQMLSRRIRQRWYAPQKQPTAKQTRHWLVWLAKKLKNQSQTEFLIEKMQPTWLSTRTSLRLYLIGVGLIFWLIGGLIFGLIFKLIAGLIFGLMGGLIGGLSGPEIEKRTFPNQGIWLCAMNAGIFALVGGLSLGLIFGLISRDKGNLTYWFLVGGLLGGHVGGLIAGFACIQHFTLRFILWRNGSIPWNYARFLNYATDRMFLQRVGGRYRFIHDLLREHFAQMPLD